MDKRKVIEGKLGEDFASKYLQKKGYKIIQRNFRIKNGEADIIAVDNKTKTLVFVEVKTRKSGEFGEPLEAITSWKLHSLSRVAEYYKMTHKNLPDLLRIDAVSVKLSFDEKPLEIEHVENISGF